MSNDSPQQTFGQYKIRKINWNAFGEVWGITIPRNIALQFEGVKFNFITDGENIILRSGLDLAKLKKNINNYNIEDYEKENIVVKRRT